METTRTQVRMPATIHQWIVQTAIKSNRSMNGEIVRMLKDVIDREKEQTKEKAA